MGTFFNKSQSAELAYEGDVPNWQRCILRRESQFTQQMLTIDATAIRIDDGNLYLTSSGF